jgi:hypothetical protein
MHKCGNSEGKSETKERMSLRKLALWFKWQTDSILLIKPKQTTTKANKNLESKPKRTISPALETCRCRTAEGGGMRRT